VKKIRIGIDVMGGDYAPFEPVKAVAELIQNSDNSIHPVLYGDATLVNPVLKELGINPADVELIHCEQVIGMSEHATRAISQKKQSSIVVGLSHLGAGELDAFVGAGNTGAMLVAAIYAVKPINGINRPTITSVLPKANGEVGILLDVGANADCKPETLNQFATLGSLYYKTVFNDKQEARVGLLNIGEEKEKGNLLTQATYPLLEANERIHFVGNIEGRDLFGDAVDVVVCDGFAGNTILKVCEGLYYNLMKRGIQDEYLNRFNFKNYGGTPILGINAPVIIGHGISKADTILKMIELGKNVVETKMIDKIKAAF